MLKTEIQPQILEEIRGILAQELQERRINPAVLPIVNAHLENTPICDIAEQFGLNALEVTLILDKPEIKSYINNWLLGYSYLNRMKRVDLIEKVMNKIISEAEEYDAPYSNKDLLDWVKIAQKEVEIIGAKEPKAANVQINNQINNNMADMISDLLDA